MNRVLSGRVDFNHFINKVAESFRQKLLNDVSVVDLTARLIHPASYHDVCVAMRNAAKNSMKGIITCTTDQVVSSDLTGFSETCIFDETAGIMLDDDFVKLIAWYDNEWGYTSKLLDLMAHMYEVDHQ